MAMSGIKIDPECKTLYESMKMGKAYKYLPFGFNNKGDKVEVEENFKDSSQSAEVTDWNSFVDVIRKDEKTPKYYLYDMEIQREERSATQVVLLISWCPDDAPIKKKMLLASTKDELMKTLGIQSRHAFQASDFSDLDIAAIESRLK